VNREAKDVEGILCNYYSLRTGSLVLKDSLNENRLSTSISISARNVNVIILPSSSVYNLLESTNKVVS